MRWRDPPDHRLLDLLVWNSWREEFFRRVLMDLIVDERVVGACFFCFWLRAVRWWEECSLRWRCPCVRWSVATVRLVRCVDGYADLVCPPTVKAWLLGPKTTRCPSDTPHICHHY